ncbi:MAG TPA: hypothetical protein VFV58_30880 [Blastocatellia bacterium]|jgi:predicted RNA-binding Zn-ribbon protein involved in translation (DUF1610 family)|nr:hypothetical protein [Blastocatellia bacterium]
MRDYLGGLLIGDGRENLKTPDVDKAQKSGATFENAEYWQGSKGSKGTFDTFEPSTDRAFVGFVGDCSQAPASVSPDVAASCPICGAVLEWKRGKHYLHVWCPAGGHFDAWRTDDGRKLKETDAPLMRP